MFSVPSSASINILKQNAPSRPPLKVLHPSGPTTAQGLHTTMTCFLSLKQLHAVHFQPSFPGQVRAAEGVTGQEQPWVTEGKVSASAHGLTSSLRGPGAP